MNDKQILRNQIRQANAQWLTQEYRENASKDICRAIAWNRSFQGTRKIGLYHALPDEPDLGNILSQFGTKKELYLPRIEGEEMVFCHYHSEKSLHKGSFGIEEPSVAISPPIDPMELELIIVPGMAFTRNGIRLGRGKAFYDKYLPQTQATLIGVTFNYRLLEDIPTETWDVLMHEIITN